MPSRPWYKFFPGDYLADTYALSWDADLLYRRILDALWIHETLPRDPRDLSKILRTDPRKISRILPELLPYLSETSGRLHHPKMTAQRAEIAAISGSRRKAAEKRWHASASQAGDASASNARSARARPDPDLNTRVPGSGFPPPPAHAPAREGGGLDPEQRAEAERIQRDLEQRRAAQGLDQPLTLRSVGGLAVAAAPKGNPEPGGES